MNPKAIHKLYAEVLALAAVAKDSYGNGNAPADLPRIAFAGLRSEVHAALLLEDAHPEPHADDEGDPDLHHARQKAHGKSLWKQTDALIAAAGITAEGVS